LIALSFLCFAISLVISAYSLWRLATMVRSTRPYIRKKPKIRRYIVTPSLFYVYGLSFFGTAALADLFFGADKGPRTALERCVLYVPLGAFVTVVTLLFIMRYIRSSRQRDKGPNYAIVYPGANECAQLPGQRFLEVKRDFGSLK
jgi:hypothetical protein